MSNTDTQTTSGNAPTHIAYHVREGSQKGLLDTASVPHGRTRTARASASQLECTPTRRQNQPPHSHPKTNNQHHTWAGFKAAHTFKGIIL
jgi:hypothetical protein